MTRMNHARQRDRDRVRRQGAADAEAEAAEYIAALMPRREIAAEPPPQMFYRFAVLCPSCGHGAVVKLPRRQRYARLRCSQCNELAPIGTRKELWKA